MNFDSQIGGMPIYDDSNFHELLTDPVIAGEQMSRGMIPRDWAREPFGSLPFARPFDFDVIPRSEWPALIEEKQANRSRLVDICDQAGLSVLNQNGTNYCWINGPTHCVEIIRVVMGLPMVRLSPASVGGPIKGYRNVGGWGTEGMKYLVEHGSVPQSMWPANAIDRRYDTPETRAIRAQFKVSEWIESRPRSFDQLATMLLLGFPVAVGYNWWRHEVTAMDLIVQGGEFGIIIDNSWGTGWGENGRGILMERKATPDDAVSPLVAAAA